MGGDKNLRERIQVGFYNIGKRGEDALKDQTVWINAGPGGRATNPGGPMRRFSASAPPSVPRKPVTASLLSPEHAPRS